MSYLRIDFYCVDAASQKWYWDYRILKLQLLWGHEETKVAAWSPASQVSDHGKSRCLWWYFPGIEKMKFNIGLVNAKTFWLAQEQKENSSTSEIYFPVLFVPPKIFYSSAKHFHFQPKLDQKSSPMDLYGLGLCYPKTDIKDICFFAQNQQDTDHLHCKNYPDKINLWHFGMWRDDFG